MHVVKLLSYIYAHLTLVETQKFECHFKNERGHPNCSHWAGNMSKESGHLTGHLELHQVCYDIQAQPCSKVDYNIYEPRPHKATSAEPRIKFQLVTKPVEGKSTYLLPLSDLLSAFSQLLLHNGV